MKILIVDDTPADLEVLTTYCRRQGYSVVTAENGADVIEISLRESPDLILMAVGIPIMSGYDVTSRIKDMHRDRWVPIILIIPQGEDQELVIDDTCEADDYITKPINLKILRKKLRVMERIIEMQRILVESIKDLQGYYNKVEEEGRLAKQVMERIMWLEEGNKESVEYWIEPSNRFSGDLIAVVRTPSNNLHIMLADVTGHGLCAALIALPIARIFYSMSDKGCPLVNIIEELNWRVNTEMPTSYFVAATLVSIDMYNRTLEIWNGGNPPSRLANRCGEIINHWESRHPPLGILNKEEFDAKTEVFSWEGPCQLVIYSDGLLEAENHEGIVFGDKQILQTLLSATPRVRFKTLVEAVKRHLAGKSAHDDISLVMIDCSPSEIQDRISQTLKERMAEKGGMDQWKWMLHLEPERLKNLNTVRVILDWLHLMGIKRTHSDRIFVIISELYNNALEHGLLSLDSHIKFQPEGFDRYMQEREERLALLDKGYITIEMEHRQVNEKEMLRIRVKDSGQGFDYNAPSPGCRCLDSKKVDTNIPKDVRPCYIGIRLVKGLCSEVHYLGNGNEVVAEYLL